jgi:hypothetical protein
LTWKKSLVFPGLADHSSMLRNSSLVILFSVLSISCSTLGKSADYWETRNKVSALIKESKFDEARALIEGRGDMCLGYNKNGFCYKGESKGAEQELGKVILTAEKCYQALQEFEGGSKTRSELHFKKDQMESACNFSGLPEVWTKRIEIASEQAKKGAETLPYSEEFKGSSSPIGKAKNICLRGFSWGYTTNNNMLNIKALKGKFRSKSECDDARVLDSISGVACYQRYLGETKKLNIVHANVMSNAGYKQDAYFTSMSACQEALSNGAPDERKEFTNLGKAIAPKNSDTQPRFIGECKSTEVIMCQEHSQSLEEIDYLN